MNNSILLFLVFMIIISFVIDESFAEILSVKTDKQFYDKNDHVIKMTVRGASHGLSSVAIHVENNNLKGFISFNPNGTGYSYQELNIQRYFQSNGTYTLRSGIGTYSQIVIFHIGDVDFIKNNTKYPAGIDNSDEFIINTNKEIYYDNDDEIFVTVSGGIFNETYEIKLHDSEGYGVISRYVTPNIDGVSYTKLPVSGFKHITIPSQFQNSGIFTISVDNDIDSQTTFKINSIHEKHLKIINLQTNKQNYYINEPILINGSIGYVDWLADTTITSSIERGGKIIQTGNYNSLQNDGTFEFMINTFAWNTDSGIHPLYVTIQNNTATIGINYHNTPDMSPETLYKIINQQNEIIESLQNTIDEIMSFLDLN